MAKSVVIGVILDDAVVVGDFMAVIFAAAASVAIVATMGKVGRHVPRCFKGEHWKRG